MTDLLTHHTVLPSVEEESLAVLTNMHQHAPEELVFELTSFSSHFEVIHGRCKASLDKSVQDVTNALHSMVLILSRARVERDRLLLPVLEGFGLIEVPHSIQNA